MELTIATATSRYVLGAEELARYPDSLLSTAFESQLEGSAGVVLDFDTFELPTHKFPHISREAVAGLVHGVYRDGKMAAVLDSLITHIKSVQNTESPTSVCEMLHEELSSLLDYFHLPAAVTSYLPPINTLGLQQGQLISFMYTAHDLEQAHKVVATMVSHKPHEAAQQPRGLAAFVVTANTSNTLPVAKLNVLLSPPEHFLSVLLQKCPFGGPWCHFQDLKDFMNTRVAILCEESDLRSVRPAEAETLHSLLRKNQGSEGQFVADNDRLGQQLPRALAAHMPNGVKGGRCGVSGRYIACGTTHYCDIPVWVLMW